MSNEPRPDEFDTGLRSIWQRRSAEVISDVDDLLVAVEDPQSVDPNSATWNTAKFKAHQLIGIVGIMQFDECVQLFRELNLLMDVDQDASIAPSRRAEMSAIIKRIRTDLAARS